MTIRTCIAVLSIIPLISGRAQSPMPEGPADPSASWNADPPQFCFASTPAAYNEGRIAGLRSGSEDDPAYASYKEGYQLILNERWKEALKKFAQVTSRYPKSGYAVDAAYWSAYALKHFDRGKAVKAYEDFIGRHPRSTYLDDVVADLAELEATSEGRFDSLDVVVNVAPTFPPDQPIPPGERNSREVMRRLTFNLRKLERINERSAEGLRRIRVPMMPFAAMDDFQSEKLDPETKVKLRALMAIGELKDDPQSFTTLKEVALNGKEPIPLRSAALSCLTKFKEADVLPVFVSVAKDDSAPELQRVATSCMVSSSHDKQRTLEALTGMYHDIARSRIDRRIEVVDAIANLGDERAVSFLSDIALSADNPDLAVTAIDGICQATASKNKAVEHLVRIFGALPANRNEQREAILYSVANVGNDRAIDFLSTVALSNDNVDTRGDAIYLLGTIGGEKARAVLYRVLNGK